MIDETALDHRVSHKSRNFYNLLGTAMMTPIEFIKAFLVMDRPLLYSQESIFSTVLNNQTVDVILQSDIFDSSSCVCSDGWECAENFPSNVPPELQVNIRCSTLDTMIAGDMSLWVSDEWWSNVANDFSLSHPANRYRFTNTSYTDSTFGKAIQKGFLVGEIVDTDYEKYFDFCAPEKCIYYQEQSRSFVDIIAILSGLVAGIARIVKPIVIVFWEIVYRKQLNAEIERQKIIRHIEPINSVESSQPVQEDEILFRKVNR